MNIFTREMKANRKPLILWGISIVAMISGGMGKFAAYTNSGESINDMLDILPKSLLNVYGISSFDLSTAIGFYGVLFLYLILIATVYAVMLGANIIAKEEKDKTTEFLFVKPVSRSKVITSKLFAVLLNIIILNIVTFIASFVIVNHFNVGNAILTDMIMLIMGMFITQLIFMCIGALVASVSKNPKAATSTAIGILLITFMISMLINMNDKLENLKYITPFKYFGAESIISGKGMDLVFITLSMVIIAISLAGTYRFYNKRDLRV
ncbi:ABC transporter permease subunit [Marinisporobacter balticus]|uniref:ABC-2 type transport system permease protein n=1 Tax=Marinisporobacter balticus TaxID=2018667 RepID=A0A4R2L733_9FIRM|nr:ABC transporter permease subunit [Marinisporobacter balticus]TCO79806.1 ABC-2 type transport system permease protein [Marinisporobacter balticus]